ncbi:uncharacterized protein LOC142645365 isoform X2 [Dermatophagoides pteronyssinus]|uniref:uncharacterized protein LOC142645365 isoform X2 n=1 Tax=Dermatophagoides pteronyssinus TaxID=6956 RepID=UPI003F680F91
MYRKIIIHISSIIIIWLSIWNSWPQYIDCIEQTNNDNNDNKEKTFSKIMMKNQLNPTTTTSSLLKRSIRSPSLYSRSSSPFRSSSSSSSEVESPPPPPSSSSSSLWNVFHWFRPSDRMSIAFLPVTNNNDDSFSGSHSPYSDRRRQFHFSGNHFIPARGKKSSSNLIPINQYYNSDTIQENKNNVIVDDYVNDDNDDDDDKIADLIDNNNNDNDYYYDNDKSIESIFKISKPKLSKLWSTLNRSINDKQSKTNKSTIIILTILSSNDEH